MAFVLAASTVVTTGAERVFWYWTTSPIAHLEVIAYYATSVVAFFWVLHRFAVDDVASLVLALPVFAYMTEGVLTPVLYSGGPFVPVFPLWFTAWHGLFATGAALFGVRWMLLSRRMGMLWSTMIALGVFWGLWSTTLWIPENAQDPELLAQHETLELLSATEFAFYAIGFSLLFALGHLVLDRTWQTSFDLPRWLRVVGVLWVAMFLISWSFAYLWAIPNVHQLHRTADLAHATAPSHERIPDDS